MEVDMSAVNGCLRTGYVQPRVTTSTFETDGTKERMGRVGGRRKGDLKGIGWGRNQMVRHCLKKSRDAKYLLKNTDEGKNAYSNVGTISHQAVFVAKQLD